MNKLWNSFNFFFFFQNNDVQDSTMLDISVEVSWNKLMISIYLYDFYVVNCFQREDEEDVIEPKRRRTTRNNNFSWTSWLMCSLNCNFLLLYKKYLLILIYFVNI